MLSSVGSSRSIGIGGWQHAVDLPGCSEADKDSSSTNALQAVGIVRRKEVRNAADVHCGSCAPPSCFFGDVFMGDRRITSGPVTNMWLVRSTMKMKSVSAGEYTAPPAHGPMMAEICGMTPLDSVLRRKMSAYPASDSNTFLNPRAAGIVQSDHRAPVFRARSMILQIFWALVSDNEPPKTVKSCAKTKAGRPCIRP